MEKAQWILQIVGTLFGGLLVAYFTYVLTLSSQKEMSDYNKRQQVYSKLIGLRFPIKQIYVSRFEALALSNFYEARWQLRGSPKDSYDFQEANRWMHQSEALVFKVIENHKELYACLADIQLLFPKTAELENLIDKIYFHKSIKLADVPKPLNETELENWKSATVAELQTLVDREYGAPIDELGAYLRASLIKEK